MSKANCGNCEFRGKASGYCRRYPPTVLLVVSPVYPYDHIKEITFPSTQDYEWCGEWKQDGVPQGFETTEDEG